MRVLLGELPLSAPRNSCFVSALLNAGACRTLIVSRYGLKRIMWVDDFCEEAGEAADAQEISLDKVLSRQARRDACAATLQNLGRE
jgi:hypothetical protein